MCARRWIAASRRRGEDSSHTAITRDLRDFHDAYDASGRLVRRGRPERFAMVDGVRSTFEADGRNITMLCTTNPDMITEFVSKRCWSSRCCTRDSSSVDRPTQSISRKVSCL